MNETEMDIGSTNSSLIERYFSLLKKSTNLLDEDEKAIVDELKNRLYSNEHARLIIWTHFLPVIILALLFYLLMSVLWLFYNYRLYVRQQAKAQKERESRCVETSRRLEFYNQIPLEVTSDNEEIELVKNIKIVENGVEVHHGNE